MSAVDLVGLDRASIHRAAGGDRPDLLNTGAANADLPVVEIDGRIAMAGIKPDLVAEAEPVGGDRNCNPVAGHADPVPIRWRLRFTRSLHRRGRGALAGLCEPERLGDL